MKQISLDDLVSLPDKNQQELDRLLAAYRRRLTELADYAKAVQAQAQTKNQYPKATMETLTKPTPDTNQPLPESEQLRDLSWNDQFEQIKKQLFEDWPPEKTGEQTIDGELQFVEETVAELSQKTWTKISQRLGSNEGGWYEKKDSDQRFYLKFYDEPEQARVEFLANQVYQHLGIKAARSELLEVDGRLAIASSEVSNAQDAEPEQQRASPDVRAGFIADAYLANWDVVGLCYDNIVANDEGLHRIDNGGSIIFRARGGLKNFPADDVPELKTMQNPEFTTGQIFGGLDEAEMAAQSKNLAAKLSPELLEQIVFVQAGLEGEVGEAVYQGLVGRRQFLIDHFNLEKEQAPPPTRSRLKQMVERIDQRREGQNQTPEKVKIRDREVLISDEDHIENQSINIIDARDRGCLEVRFKLTADHYQRLVDQLQSQVDDDDNSSSNAHSRPIVYRSADPEKRAIIKIDAWELSHNGLDIKVAKPRPKLEADPDDSSRPDAGQGRSFLGLVAIDIPYRNQPEIDLEEMEDRLNDLLVNLLEIPRGLTEPDPESERAYKQARYAWHHCLDPQIVKQDYGESVDYLERREVFDGYSTMVSEGIHHHYEQMYGEYAPYHCLWHSDMIAKILTSGGLMSSHERFSRGLSLEGQSTRVDLDTGGGDSVFVKTIVDNLQETTDQQTIPGGRYYVVLGPEVFDRTDSYCHPYDYYGSTDESYFIHRQSPQDMLLTQAQRGLEQLDETEADQSASEQMFRCGISSETFRGIACSSNPTDRKRLTEALLKKMDLDQEQQDEIYRAGPQAVAAFLEQRCGQKDIINQVWDQGPQAVRDLAATWGIKEVESDFGLLEFEDWLAGNNRMKLIDSLRQAGFEQVNGVPVEKFVVEAKNQYDFVDIAHNRQPRSKGQANQDRAYRRPPPAKTKSQRITEALS